ncbi:pyruvate kinase [Candidatus Pelagibacter sp.]|nr:pyruvate kinase [Candidatus Pelagibacter sp.]
MFKIVSTIGPISANIVTLKKIINSSDLIRLNGAHNTIEWHKNTITKIRKINPQIPILVDLPGIKPRTNNVKNIFINKNQIYRFSYQNKIKKSKNDIFLSNPLPEIIKDKKFTLSDGNFNFIIKKKRKNEIYAKSLQSFVLFPQKGVNFLNSKYDEKNQRKKYFKYLKVFSKLKPDAVGLSYIQSANILFDIKKKFNNLILVSKIENFSGLLNSKSISEVSDMVMIDRGDLSAEIGSENLFSSIKEISKNVKKSGKPLIMATENLESMTKKTNPSKSEVVAMGFNLDLGADCIMLSEETAISESCLKILAWLNNFRNKLRDSSRKKSTLNRQLLLSNFIEKLDGQTLVIFSKKGYAVESVNKINDKLNIILFTDNRKLLKISSLRRNVLTIFTKKFDNKNLEKFIYKNIKKHKKIIFRNTRDVIILRIIYPMSNSRANNISIVNYKNFK